MTTKNAIVLLAALLLVGSAGAQEVVPPEARDTGTLRPALAPPPSSAVMLGSQGRLDDPPEFEALDHDEFLGRISSMPAEAFAESVDPFSGTLHLAMTDAVVPGNGGLDIVIQRYYSSAVLNRVDNVGTWTRHAASADLSGHLGDSGWQLHMGKLMNVFPGPDNHTTLIMPDGSTHPLYNRLGYSGEKITPEGWVYSFSGTAHTVRTTTGLLYTFDPAASDGAQYNYMGMDSGAPIQVIQCTRIEDLSGNAITVEYSRWTGQDADFFKDYITFIDEVRFDPTDGRRVVFTYWPDDDLNRTICLQSIDVMDGDIVLQTWGYGYGEPWGHIPQVQYPYEIVRPVSSLTSVHPPEGLSWKFRYNPVTDLFEDGRWLLKTILSPRDAKTQYTWAPEGFDTGAFGCSDVPEFLALQERQTSFSTDGGSTFEDESTTTYDYVYGVPEDPDPKTTVETTDSQTDIKLRTEEHVFHGWSVPPAQDDPGMWRVGREKSSTVVIKDDLGEDLETTTTTTVWEQGDDLSAYTLKTSGWATCSLWRQDAVQTYVKPTSVTRVVERHDSIPDPPPPPPVPDPASYTTVTSQFDDWGNPGLVEETSSDGLERTTHLTYWKSEANNQYLGFVEGRDPDPGGAQCFQYDSHGRLASSFTNPEVDQVTVCQPTGGVLGARRVDLVYYPDGNPFRGNLFTKTEVAFPDSQVTTYSDYQYGRPGDTVVATGSGPGTDIHFCREYGPLGTLTWETDGRGCDEPLRRTLYEYDTYNRLTMITPPVTVPPSYPTTFDYYDNWTRTRVTRGGQIVHYWYDRFGNLRQIDNLQSHHVINLTNDALGRRREVSIVWDLSPLTPGDTFQYDPLGRLTSVIHPDDPPSQVTFDYAGSVVTFADENDYHTQYTYEAFGDPSDRRLAQLLDAEGYTTTYEYDPLFGNLATVTPPLDQGIRSFHYISASSNCDNGFLRKESHKESGDTTYEYNCLGLVTKRTREGGEDTFSTYDSAGRLKEIAYQGGAGTVAIGYDGASHRTSLSNLWASAIFTFDNAGRLETATRSIDGGPAGLLTTYGYDNFDRLKTITYPSGRIVTYGWDTRNWLTSVAGEEGSGVAYITSVTYWEPGTPHVVTFANNAHTEYTIDDRNRVTNIDTMRFSFHLQSVGFQYDLASNVVFWQDWLEVSKTRSFGYDQLNRLTSAVSGGLWGSLGYTYDALGNRETKTHDGEVTTYEYDNITNRLTGLTGAEEGTFEYDDLGRVRTEVRSPVPWDVIFCDGFESGNTNAWEAGAGPAGTLVYTFNAADQLLEIEEAGQVLGVYAYDGDGLRVSKTEGGETVYYLRDEAGNTLAEYDGTGQLIAEYLYASGRQIGKIEPDGLGGDDVSYFHPDHLGSAMLITDDLGYVTWSGEYEPFGEPVTSTGTPDRYRFTQHELDTETNLVYAKARYYHPRIGRFISVDPKGGNAEDSQSWNKYAYALNNPLKYVDLDGRDVTYGSPLLQKFYENAAERNSGVKATLEAYGPGSGRDLHIEFGDPGSRKTGTKNAGVFSVKMSYTATSEEQVAAWEAAGGGEAGTKAADKGWEDSFGPIEATIILSKTATTHQKLHELGHADHAVRDPRGYLELANEAAPMPDADYRKSDSETIADDYARAAARKDK